jgi:phosphoribosylformimino-5-aminoimidazole carboxamide ribotide isomerase
VADAAARFRQSGVAALIVTDVSRDGTQQGADVPMFAEISRLASTPVIASGGVATLDDVRSLSRLFADGIVGVIAGRALYEGRFRLAEALAISA